jgi:hypothetical protein
LKRSQETRERLEDQLSVQISRPYSYKPEDWISNFILTKNYIHFMTVSLWRFNKMKQKQYLLSLYHRASTLKVIYFRWADENLLISWTPFALSNIYILLEIVSTATAQTWCIQSWKITEITSNTILIWTTLRGVNLNQFSVQSIETNSHKYCYKVICEKEWCLVEKLCNVDV